MSNDKIKVGSIVQLDPEFTENKMFVGCFLVVTEIKSWGVQGYVQGLGSDGNMGGHAYYRAKKETFQLVGNAKWIIE